MTKASVSCEMIRHLDEVSGRRPEEVRDELSCGLCYGKAELFQVTGNYCLHCWQQETHPDV
jgi:hypothetical protein